MVPIVNLMKDFVQVSRPGWWLVMIWLYMAPIPYATIFPPGGGGGIVAPTWKFDLAGLFFCCVPLNAWMYSINDYADRETDRSSPRKGNWVFGPKGWTKTRIGAVLLGSTLLTFGFLVFWGIESSYASSDRRWLVCYLAWFLAAAFINVVYNANVLPSMCELPFVYVGFGMVTLLSYWRHHHHPFHDHHHLENDHRDVTLDDETFVKSVLGFRILRDFDEESAQDDRDTTMLYLAGCNAHYWIHLLFLIVRSQYWTEYMDYESDRANGKWTTLSRLATKRGARNVLLAVFGGEVLFCTIRYGNDPHGWAWPWIFSIMGTALFLKLDRTNENDDHDHDHDGKGAAGAGGTVTKDELVRLAGQQTLGGLWLLYQVWSRGVFVK